MERSLWQATPGQQQAYEALREDVSTPVLVVGAGMTGLLTAWRLQERGIETVVIDAAEVGGATSGKSTGKLTAQHGDLYHRLLEQGAEQAARSFYKLNMQGIAFVCKLCEELAIDCALQSKTAWLYTTRAEGVRPLSAEYDAYRRLGIPGRFAQELPVPIGVRAAVAMEGQYAFHPYRFLQGLAAAYRARGGRIYTHTPAVKVEERTDGVLVETAGGARISCEKLVIASHFPFYDGWGLYFARLVPSRSYIVAGRTELCDDGMYLSIDDEPMDRLRSVNFVTIDGERYLLVGGEGHRTGEQNPGAFEKLEDFGRGVFGLDETQYRWSAQDYGPTDLLPYIGRLTREDSRIFVATGFNKWGNSTAAVAALILEELVASGGSPYEELFRPTRAESVFSADFLKNGGEMVGNLFARAEGEEVFPQTPGEGKVVVHRSVKMGAYRHSDGSLHLVDINCPHMGCELRFNPVEHTWDCPCHGSRFAYDGALLEGPAMVGLKRYEL